MVVDEAHKIKNPNSQITEAMKALKCQVSDLCVSVLSPQYTIITCVVVMTNISVDSVKVGSSGGAIKKFKVLVQVVFACCFNFHQVRIGLTGTILQNNLEELWCVMDWYVSRLHWSLYSLLLYLKLYVSNCADVFKFPVLFRLGPYRVVLAA